VKRERPKLAPPADAGWGGRETVERLNAGRAPRGVPCLACGEPVNDEGECDTCNPLPQPGGPW
jgi:hypothetical protein